jgi:hypothetical protein
MYFNQKDTRSIDFFFKKKVTSILVKMNILAKTKTLNICHVYGFTEIFGYYNWEMKYLQEKTGKRKKAFFL